MKTHCVKGFLFLLLALVSAIPLRAQQNAADSLGLSGEWQLIPDESTEVTFYQTISMKVDVSPTTVTLVRKWVATFSKVDSFTVTTDGQINKVPVTNRVWPADVFMGVSMIPGSEKSVTAQWVEKNKTLKVDESYPVLVSQGQTEIHTTTLYTLSDNGQLLSVNVQRSSHLADPVTYVFRRGALKPAYYMTLDNKWEVDGSLSENAFLLSLQGVANSDTANLYFVYPEDYDYRFTQKMFDFYKQHLGYSFTRLGNMASALKTFRDHVKGYIIWDKTARPSLNVAFTLAGLEKAVVVTQDMVPMVKAAGLKQIADFRGKFNNMTDAQVYGWAYNHYWARCNQQYIIWMGGVAGNEMKPGIADFGVSKGCFFADLSTDPADSVEYALADKIFSHMKPLSMVMGWHSYAKDLERNYVGLASRYALRVEGLNTFPNLSFTSRTPPSAGFTFRNNHNVVPHGVYTPKKKVYITCVQTDGLGLGAWTGPGRGSIPYAWEVTINWQWMAPVLLEYYYTTATSNDYFFGSLSGPGYMYPKAIPRNLLPEVIQKADELCRKLDLNVFETMDYSQGSTVVGNTNLPQYIVDDYYKYMPDMIGFLNGYAPSFTFSHQNGRPFISYDYYLDENRPEKDATADLKELISLNKQRPYFLLLHVREWNNIDRVKRILDALGSDVEVVPLDIFLKLAGSQPTFKTRYMDASDSASIGK